MVHKALVLNLLRNIDSRQSGILDWSSYLHAMTLIYPFNFETRVDSLISTIAKETPSTLDLIYEIVKSEGGGIPREEELLQEKSIDFDDFRHMCLYGITPQHEVDFTVNNPYRHITDYDSYTVKIEDYKSFEESMGDFYARKFYKKMNCSLKWKVPVSYFKRAVMNGNADLRQ